MRQAARLGLIAAKRRSSLGAEPRIDTRVFGLLGTEKKCVAIRTPVGTEIQNAAKQLHK